MAVEPSTRGRRRTATRPATRQPAGTRVGHPRRRPRHAPRAVHLGPAQAADAGRRPLDPRARRRPARRVRHQPTSRFCVGYLSHLIRAVFDHRDERGRRDPTTSRSTTRSAPPGRCGSSTDLDDTFVVMNGDVLTNARLRASSCATTSEHGNALTIATHDRPIKIDYGVPAAARRRDGTRSTDHRVPGEAGDRLHGQHGHLRARAVGARLRPRAGGRSTSPTSSTPCSRGPTRRRLPVRRPVVRHRPPGGLRAGGRRLARGDGCGLRPRERERPRERQRSRERPAMRSGNVFTRVGNGHAKPEPPRRSPRRTGTGMAPARARCTRTSARRSATSRAGHDRDDARRRHRRTPRRSARSRRSPPSRRSCRRRSTASPTCSALIEESGRFAVNLLAADQADIGLDCAKKGEDKLAVGELERRWTACPGSTTRPRGSLRGRPDPPRRRPRDRGRARDGLRHRRRRSRWSTTAAGILASCLSSRRRGFRRAEVRNRRRGATSSDDPIESVEVFSTCPQSKDVDRRPSTCSSVADVARWSEEAGYRGILVYTDNGIVDPWLVSQVILQSTEQLCPLVAIQPIYMHPYTAAKMVASLAFLHERRDLPEHGRGRVQERPDRAQRRDAARRPLRAHRRVHADHEGAALGARARSPSRASTTRSRT